MEIFFTIRKPQSIKLRTFLSWKMLSFFYCKTLNPVLFWFYNKFKTSLILTNDDVFEKLKMIQIYATHKKHMNIHKKPLEEHDDEVFLL